jgi:hypothetical protein
MSALFIWGNHLVSIHSNFHSLLFDPKTKTYYLRGTYALSKPIALKSGKWIHFIAVEFDLRKDSLRVLPGFSLDHR